jgi:alpha-mannosidase
MFLRPAPREKTLPAEAFWWASPDGSRVLAYRIPYNYESGLQGDLETFLGHALERVPANEEQLMVFYGVGNHGGGPTRDNLDSICRLNAADNGLRLEPSSPRSYFDAMAGRTDLPTYVGDLQHHAVGCYSAHSGVKRWNRRAEHLLLAAERWCSVAAHLGGPAYPAAELAQAWKSVLFNQFHDILAGTAIAPAYDDARDQYGHASSVAAHALNLAVQSVTRRIGIRAEEGTVPYVIVNPLPWPVSADVEFELEALSMAEVVAEDEETGAPVPVQRVPSLATLGGRHRRVVLAADVPALGYRVYRLRPQNAGAPEAGEANPEEEAGHGEEAVGNERGPIILENAHLRVVVDPATGWLASLFDKDRQAELVPEATSAHAIVLDDRSDTWSHDLVAYEGEIGRFACTSVRRTEDGLVRSVIEVESTFGASRLVERLVLGAQARHLEVRALLDWREHQRVLKLRFPSRLEDPTVTFSVPYGRIERPGSGSEEVGQAWVDVSGALGGGQKAGWGLLNDGKYGYDVRGAEIGMTAARSPVYAWHHPYQLRSDVRYEYLDQGPQEFTYALVPHGGDLDEAGVVRLAEELNERPLAFPEHFHPGPLPPAQGFADDGGGAVMLSVLKQAEDGDAFIVRAYETTGRPSSARLELPLLDRTIDSSFAPGEIKTFFIPTSAGPVEEVSLLEWPAGLPREKGPGAEGLPAGAEM